MPKKRLDKNPKEKIKVLIKESCVAEMTHAVSAIVGWICVKIWSKYGFYMSVLWTCFNLPFILIQRYNRPRLTAVCKQSI